ncbi:YhgE/Pip domain-containing protein [Alkalibaculum sp. M08DMB]|uniref:YhgE/Pip domain-containing protein n=1 Tax=Alkalibaculum sporogenes TaxID=2655001 RepID=A0A6A7K890_9FIRM|nr:YhgE/Pip domain-containing protein [Alkalibaculum sporogenes]MPW25719.1 YhgE/Pip domain-containing protein [Alkalibaculum sporogenes]
MKKFLSIFLTVIFIFTVTVPVIAAEPPTQKEEVVYGTLGLEGSVNSIYVVNSFKGGMITDYGSYSTVRNMTSSEKLTQTNDMITINTTDDSFYYQGTLESKELPWKVSADYQLDKDEISPSELAGKNGALSITISITQNESINPVFYENYILQVSLTFDSDKCTDIVSPNATIANAGKNKVITHTVMPGEIGEITITANVQDFTMSGIEISAMPISMNIEMPDTDSLVEDMISMSDAVSNLNKGVNQLSNGITQTYLGAQKLDDGSSEFADGLLKLSNNSGELINASTQIKGALSDIAKNIDGESTGEFDLGDLAALPDGLRQLEGGLREITDGMQTLKSGYNTAYSALDSTISTIPDTDIDPTELYTEVHGNDQLSASLDKLMEYYVAGKTVKGTYASVKEAFEAVDSSLDTIAKSIDIIAEILSKMANEIEQSLHGIDVGEQIQQLKDGMSKLSNSYYQFHTGLSVYTSGVKSISGGYDEVHTGINSLTKGIGDLSMGAKDLNEGTSKLNDAVADIPDTIQVEIEEMTKNYDRSDFTPKSFVSDKNTDVTLVQFVLKTAPIELSEELKSPDTEPEMLTFWQKLLNLFGLY